MHKFLHLKNLKFFQKNSTNIFIPIGYLSNRIKIDKCSALVYIIRQI